MSTGETSGKSVTHTAIDEAYNTIFVENNLPASTKEEVEEIKSLLNKIKQQSISKNNDTESTIENGFKGAHFTRQSTSSSTSKHSQQNATASKKTATINKSNKTESHKSPKSGKRESSKSQPKIASHDSDEEAQNGNTPQYYMTTVPADEESTPQLSKSKRSQKKDKKGIEEPPINRWFCEFCTLANSIEYHICQMCGKTNDEIRELNASKYGALSKINKSNWKLENRNIEENNSIDSIMDYDDDDPYFQKFLKTIPNQEKIDNSDDSDHSYKSAENVPFNERTAKDIDVSRGNREPWYMHYWKQFTAWRTGKDVEERNIKDRLNHTSWDELDENIKKCYRRLLTEEIVKTEFEAQQVAMLIRWFPHLDEDSIIKKYIEKDKNLEITFKKLLKKKK